MRNVSHILYIIISLFILGCSTSSQIKTAPKTLIQRPFLSEYKKFSLTYGDGNSVYDISLDGKGEFAYISREEGGNTDIFALDTYTLKKYRLTKSPSIDLSPSVDIKKKYLVFSSTRDDAFSDIYIYNFNKYYVVKSIPTIETFENNIKRLTSYKGIDKEPQISHEGNLIVFVSDRWDNTPTLHVMNTAGKNIQRITDIPSQSPAFSFDDSKVAFVTMNIGDAYSQIAYTDIANSNTTIITESKTLKFNPSFYNDDIILYFEIEKDTDKDNRLTYKDEKRLMAYSFSLQKSYTIENNTKLTKLNTPYPSSVLGAFLEFNSGSLNALVGNTKEYFIKDSISSEMYKTFLSLPYEKKLSSIERFSSYFPGVQDENYVANAYLTLMLEAYKRGEYKDYIYAKHNILKNYKYTEAGITALSIERMTFKNNIQKINTLDEETKKYITNLTKEEMEDIKTPYYGYEALTNMTNRSAIMAEYIIAKENHGAQNIEISSKIILSNAIYNKPMNKEEYMPMVNLYSKILIDEKEDIGATNFTDLYTKDFLTLKDKLDMSKEFVSYAISKNLNQEEFINNITHTHPISIEGRLMYIESLILVGSVDYAKSLFNIYAGEKDPSLLSIMYYGLGKIDLYLGNISSYVLLEDSLKRKSDFLITTEAEDAKDILSKYYIDIANSSYDKGEYRRAYDNYNLTLQYNSKNNLAARRAMETGLRSSSLSKKGALETIDNLERTVRKHEKNLLNTKYSDPFSHIEIATAYYYLANIYYNYAMENADGKNRYILSQNRRQDGFSLYLMKAFDTIIGNAAGSIDIAIFLSPETVDYYILKSQMLATAMAMRVEIKAENRKERSLLDLVPIYKNDETETPNPKKFGRYQMRSDTLESDILNALIEAKRQVSLISKEGNPHLSLMLANAYLINGRYIEGAEEYKEAEKYIPQTQSLKEKAWYHFFYGYCLWINGDTYNAIEQYKKAYDEFLEINDNTGLFRALGYLAVSYIDTKDYNLAIKYLKDRETVLTQNKIDTTLNDLLLGACYLKSNNYESALEYCDKAKPVVDKLNSNIYSDNYITASVFGSVLPIVNMGLAAFGGYIPDEPLNVDKKEMLYSLYQEIYEKTAMYSEARKHLEEYKNITTRDKTKKDIHPIFLSMYKNNEGALYYMEGDSINAAKSFEDSIKEYEKSLKPNEDKFKNAQNDAINYVNLSAIYLNIISDSEITNRKEKLKAFSELNKMLPSLDTLSSNPSVNKKNKLLIHTHIAAINYVFAKFSANVFTNKTSLDMHDDNIKRIDRIKTAVKHYRYVLSPEAALPIDAKTEIVVSFNLGLCYEFMQNIEDAAREYTAAYSKASKNSFTLEEIGILTTMIEFSRRYYNYAEDTLFKPEVYANLILSRLRNTVYTFAIYNQSRLVLYEAKNALFNYYSNEKPEFLAEIAALFDAVNGRTRILQKQIYTYNENIDKYLREYYKLYNDLYFEYKKYIELTSEEYNKKAELSFTAKLKETEKKALKQFEKTPIEIYAIGNINKNTIKNILRKDETLIWDISRNKRIIIQNGRISEIKNTTLPNLTEYVTHIGFREITNITNGKQTFFRRFTTSAAYYMPESYSLFDNNKYAMYFKNRRDIVSENTNTNTNGFTNIDGNTNVNLVYALDTTNKIKEQNIQFTKTKQNTFIFTNGFELMNITNAAATPYIPYVIDMTGCDIKTIESFAQKEPYIIYIDKETYQSNRRAVNRLNPYVMVIGNGTNARRMFYTNYIFSLATNSVENVMRGYDLSLFNIYGKATFNPTNIDNKIEKFQSNILCNYTHASGRNKLEAMTNLIWYASTDDKKLLYSKIILEDTIKNKRTNISYNVANSTYNFFTNTASSNFSETNAYMFMNTLVNYYNLLGEAEAFKNAYRVLDYINNYPKTAYLVVSNYTISPMSVIRYASKETDAKKVVEYLDAIIPYLEDRSYGRSFIEYAIVYKTLYAKTPLENSSYMLSKVQNKDELVTTLETLSKPINTLTEKDVFFTMNYLYSKSYIFKSSTIEEFADKYYSLYKTNASYIFGLLEKRRYSTPEFEKYIIDTENVFNNEDTNSIFCFYAVEGNRYTAYVYGKGYSEVKRYRLGLTNTLRPLLTEYTNFQSSIQREKVVLNIQKETLDKQMFADFANAKNVYITGALDIYSIPFAFFKMPDGKYFDNAIKIRSIKYGEKDVLYLKDKVSFISFDNNFYSSLEQKALENSFNISVNENGFIHYRGNTNTISNFTGSVFMSPIQRQTLNRYLRDDKIGVMLYTYSYEEKGDYYLTMKNLYANFTTNDIITSYKNIRNTNTYIPPIKSEDNSIRYGANMLFDYILPYVPK